MGGVKDGTPRFNEKTGVKLFKMFIVCRPTLKHPMVGSSLRMAMAHKMNHARSSL